MPLCARRALASAVNVLVAMVLSLPLAASGVDREVALILAFASYNLVCEAAFGRCLGSVAAGLHWAGQPSMVRRLIFCLTYTMAFTPYVIWPLWQAVPNLTVQWLWGRFVGGTVHSWLAGVASEVER